MEGWEIQIVSFLPNILFLSDVTGWAWTHKRRKHDAHITWQLFDNVATIWINKLHIFDFFLMNHQQGLAIALSTVCVCVCDFTDCVIVPIPGDKHDAGAAGINIQQGKLQKHFNLTHRELLRCRPNRRWDYSQTHTPQSRPNVSGGTKHKTNSLGVALTNFSSTVFG